MSTHNLCFVQKFRSFLSENFQFLEMKFSIYLNRHFSMWMENLVFFFFFFIKLLCRINILP